MDSRVKPGGDELAPIAPKGLRAARAQEKYNTRRALS
jgi:hypothetical protein